MSPPPGGDPFWFLDTRRLPLPMQLWVLFSMLPTIFVVSYLPYQQEELVEYLSKLPRFVVWLIQSCEITTAGALFASILYGQLRRESDRSSSKDKDRETDP